MALLCPQPCDLLSSTPHDVRPTRRFAPRRKNLPKTRLIALRPCKCSAIWRRCVRGEVYQLNAPRRSRDHEQSRSRYAVVVQSDQLPLSTWLVAPTSTSARAASFRPEVEIGGVNTRVLAEQAAAVDPSRLGNSVGRLSFEEMRRVDAALRSILDL